MPFGQVISHAVAVGVFKSRKLESSIGTRMVVKLVGCRALCYAVACSTMLRGDVSCRYRWHERKAELWGRTSHGSGRILAAVFILYVLSIGPAFRLGNDGYLDGRLWSAIFCANNTAPANTVAP